MAAVTEMFKFFPKSEAEMVHTAAISPPLLHTPPPVFSELQRVIFPTF